MSNNKASVLAVFDWGWTGLKGSFVKAYQVLSQRHPSRGTGVRDWYLPYVSIHFMLVHVTHWWHLMMHVQPPLAVHVHLYMCTCMHVHVYMHACTQLYVIKITSMLYLENLHAQYCTLGTMHSSAFVQVHDHVHVHVHCMCMQCMTLMANLGSLEPMPCQAYHTCTCIMYMYTSCMHVHVSLLYTRYEI